MFWYGSETNIFSLIIFPLFFLFIFFLLSIVLAFQFFKDITLWNLVPFSSSSFSFFLPPSISFYSLPVSRDFGEDSRLSWTGSGSKRDDTNDIIGAAAIVAHKGAARVTHASGPESGLTESDDVVRKGVVLVFESRCRPDFASDLRGEKKNGKRVLYVHLVARWHWFKIFSPDSGDSVWRALFTYFF